MSHRTCLVILIFLLSPAVTAQKVMTEDPAPPKVFPLKKVEAIAAKSHAGLVTHATPRARAAGSVDEDWPGFLGAARDSYSRETGLLESWGPKGPTLLWEMPRGQGYAAPAVMGDRVVFTHRVGGTVHVDCLEATTGRRFWRFSYETDYRSRYIKNSGPRSTPAIANDRVIVHAALGELYCLALSTGQVLWQRNLAKDLGAPTDFFGAVASPLIMGGRVIINVGAPEGPCVAAFDLETGRMHWGNGSVWGPSCASPVPGMVDGEPRVFVLAGGESKPPTGGLMVLDPRNGRIAHQSRFRSRTYESVLGTSPTLGDGWVFLSSAYNVGSAAYSLKKDDRYRQLWKSRRIGLQFSNAVHHDGHVYCIDGKSDRPGAIVCIEPTTGKELSRTDLTWDEDVVRNGREITVSMSIGEGSLLKLTDGFLCLGDNGHLLRLECTPKGTKVISRAWLFRANESWTPLALSRGLLYVCQNNRERFGDLPARLLCYDLRK